MLDKGWLQKQAASTAKEVANWPPLLREAAVRLSGRELEGQQTCKNTEDQPENEREEACESGCTSN